MSEQDSERNRDAEIQGYRNDVSGLPRELTNSEGIVTWRAVHQPLRYQGQYLNAEIGLHYNLFRYYDPQCGRFTLPDPKV